MLQQDHGYTRLPAYIGASVRPQQQSVLKSSVLRVHSGEEAPSREETGLRVSSREEGAASRGRGRVIVRRAPSSGSSSGEEGGARVNYVEAVCTCKHYVCTITLCIYV